MSNLTGRQGLGQKAPKPAKKQRSRIPQVSAKTKSRKASADGKAGAFRMGQVAQCPCVICGAWPVEVHHTICGRFGSRKSSDFSTIPLCWACHQGPDGIHASKERWVERNGLDTDYLPEVDRMIAAMGGNNY